MTASPVPTIPNRFLFVWTGARFPYHCRLAVESALLADPDAEVMVATFGDRPDGRPHFEAVKQYRRVTIEDVDLAACFAGLDAPPKAWLDILDALPRSDASARSDLVRYGLLHRLGGVYLDLDVLVLRDLRHLLHHPAFFGEERVWKVNEARVEGRIRPWMLAPTVTYGLAYALRWIDARLLGGRRLTEPLARPLDPVWSEPKLNNAVIGAAAGSPFLRRVLDGALRADPAVRYGLGPTLVTRVFRSNSGDVVRLPEETFFVQPPSYSFRFFHGRHPPLPDAAVLIHYVSSNHAALLDQMDADAIADPGRGALFYQLARQVARRAADLPRKP